MIKHFQSCFQVTLKTVLTPRPDPAPNAAALRRELRSGLAEAEKSAAGEFGAAAAEAARRLVTIWIDETLLSTPWAGRREWLASPLQRDWAEGRAGGDWFFEELETLSPASRSGRALAELALRCLSFGLTGRFRRQPEELRAARRRLAAEFGFKPETPVFPPPPAEGRRPGRLPGPKTRRLIFLAVLGLALTWLLGDMLLERQWRQIPFPGAGTAASGSPETGP